MGLFDVTVVVLSLAASPASAVDDTAPPPKHEEAQPSSVHPYVRAPVRRLAHTPR